MTIYKGILLDLDNTLYHYKSAHFEGLRSAIEKLSSKTGYGEDELNIAYGLAREQIHQQLDGQGASHHRLLYFQRLLEILDRQNLPLVYEAYQSYWEGYLNTMKPTCDLKYFFNAIHPLPVCIVTDFTAEMQYIKMQRLGILENISHLVTSEEAGKDKPDPAIFNLGLKKLGISAEDACMIGDNYEKDILGATALGIKSYWLTNENKPALEGLTIIKHLNELLEKWKCQVEMN